MKKEIQVLTVASIMTLVLLSPSLLASDTAVTGTFVASGTLDVDIQNASLNLHTINAGAMNQSNQQIVNNGDVSADVNHITAVSNGSMALGTNGSLGVGEFSVLITPNGSWLDISEGQQTLSDNLPATGQYDSLNYTIAVWVTENLGAETSYCKFWANISVAQAS